MNVKKFALVAAAAAPNRHSSITTTVKNTAKTINLQVIMSNKAPLVSVDEMEAHLSACGSDMGLYISHTTTLGRKRYPGNRHWHFKQKPKEPGCLDVTYWPEGHAMWISVRRKEPRWVHEAGPELKSRLELAINAQETDGDDEDNELKK